MEDLKALMQGNYIKYASYVILDRAIPNVVDGLKPVQRRILHTLYTMHDGKLHKVANVAGQTMVYHPHGDAAIIDALVNLANKGYLLDKQGNFGNIATGDPAAAARYIETRLSDLAKETLFNPDITATIPSYDGRHQEPVVLPAKIPLLLMQGASGIAVGMSTNIMPHNFAELIQAEIAILEGKPFLLLPDFPTGGILDPSQYDKGRGKLKLRAKVEIKDPKTLIIREVCYGTTTESLMQSIDEAAKKGKIKIDSINDYTSENVEIAITLPRGQYAEEVIKSLYAYTDCEVTLHSQIVVIKDHMPWETDVDEIVKYHVEKLTGYLKQELEIEKSRLHEKIYERTLERIFIENRLYKHLEKVTVSEKLHETVAKSLVPFHPELLRTPTADDITKLLAIPIRRISLFDLSKNQQDIALFEKDLTHIEDELSHLKKTTINYLKALLKKYGKDFPRKTQVTAIEEIDVRAIAKRDVKVGFDTESGFVGTRVTTGELLVCTAFDKILLIFSDGTYRIISIPEKQYVLPENGKLIFVGVADKSTVFHVVYKDPKTHIGFAKRFVVKQYILDKIYRYFEDDRAFLFMSAGLPPVLDLHFFAKLKAKISQKRFSFESVRIKSVSAKGLRLATRGIKNIVRVDE